VPDLREIRELATRRRALAAAAAEGRRDAASRRAAASKLLDAKQLEAALAEAQAAVGIDPDAADGERLLTRIQSEIEEQRRLEELARAAREAAEAAATLRLQERRKREEAARLAEQQQWLDGKLAAARVAIDGARFDDALRTLDEISARVPDATEVSELRESAVAARRHVEVERRRREGEQAAEKARKDRERRAAEERRLELMATSVATTGPSQAVGPVTIAESRPHPLVAIPLEEGSRRFGGPAVAASIGLAIVLTVAGGLEWWRTRPVPAPVTNPGDQSKALPPAANSRPTPPVVNQAEGTPPALTPNDPTTPIRQRLRDAIARGDGQQALVTVTEALKLKPDDAEFLRRLVEMIRTAEVTAGRARDEAVQAGAPDLATAEYQQALARLAEATKLRRAQKPDAVRAFSEATDLFGKAGSRAASVKVQRDEEEARRKAQEVAAVRQREQEAAAARQREQEAADARRRAQEAADARRGEQEAADARQRAQEAADARQREQDGRAAQMRVDAERAIQQVLNQYVAAYNALDSTAVAQLVPSQSVTQLAQQFALLRSYNVTLVGTRINLDGDTATVACVRHIVAVGKNSATGTNVVDPQTTFRLRRSGRSWTIESVR
jgi:hypothetical protein